MRYRQCRDATLGLLALLCVTVHAGDPVPGKDVAVDCEDCRDCSDVIMPPGKYTYLVTLKPGPNKTMEALCYPDRSVSGDKRPWTVIQSRYAGSHTLNFTRGWEDYKKGFGYMNSGYMSSFWWGNENLWLLSSLPDRRYELRVYLGDIFRTADPKITNYYAARYIGFKVSSESDGYRLTLGNYMEDNDEENKAVAGDGLSWHSGMKFTTIDCDEDNLDGDN